MNQTIGRPQISDRAKDLLVRKLEPYLHSGISLRKACQEAKVNRAWVYTLIQRDDTFADQITHAKEFLGVYFNHFVFRIVSGYCYRILSGQQLESEELNFLKWFALHARATYQEFGQRINTGVIIDTEMEFRRFKQIQVRNSKLQS
jgi:hypothetical protein